MDLKSIAQIAGGEFRGRYAVIPGPGHSRSDRSLSLSIGEGGRIVWHSFANDPVPEVLRYLESLGYDHRAHPDPERDAERERLAAETRADKRKTAQRLFARGVPIEKTLAEKYLRVGRRLGPDLELPSFENVRFLKDCPYTPYAPDRRVHPAMLAKITHPETGEHLGTHVTFLDGSGLSKAAGVDAPRKVLGSQSQGVIFLGRETSPAMAVLAEGIESALSASKRTRLPGVAAINADNLAKALAWERLEGLLVAHDRDKSGVGLKAAQTLKARLQALGVSVQLLAPPASLKDWNDVEGL